MVLATGRVPSARRGRLGAQELGGELGAGPRQPADGTSPAGTLTWVFSLQNGDSRAWEAEGRGLSLEGKVLGAPLCSRCQLPRAEREVRTKRKWPRGSCRQGSGGRGGARPGPPTPRAEAAVWSWSRDGREGRAPRGAGSAGCAGARGRSPLPPVGSTLSAPLGPAAPRGRAGLVPGFRLRPSLGAPWGGSPVAAAELLPAGAGGEPSPGPALRSRQPVRPAPGAGLAAAAGRGAGERAHRLLLLVTHRRRHRGQRLLLPAGGVSPAEAAAGAEQERVRGRGHQPPDAGQELHRPAGPGGPRCPGAPRAHGAADGRRAALQVLGGGRAARVPGQCQHGLALADAGEGAGRGAAQLQPAGRGPGEDLPDLLGAGRAPRRAAPALAPPPLLPHQPGPAPARPLRRGAHRGLLLGLAARALPRRPHPGPGGAAGGDAGGPALPLRLGDGLLPHHPLQPPGPVLAGAGQRAARGGLQPAGARAPAGQLLAAHGPRHVPLPALPTGLQQPRGQRVPGREGLHCAGGESLPHPVQQNEPQQVHGHGEGGLRRHFQLVGRLLQQHVGRGAGGEPAGGRLGAGAAAAAVRARLELPIRRAPGRAGAGPGLRVGGLRLLPASRTAGTPPPGQDCAWPG